MRGLTGTCGGPPASDGRIRLESYTIYFSGPVSSPPSCVVGVFADFVIQTAGLYPLIDGEAVERILIASNIGEKSKTTFVTKSDRKISEEEMLRRMGGG